ncbi:uncharacterized protein LOC125061545 [Pieris napi]|uniref:uncharacterized protein LOC125061545 n=1 Tax=Pieris napi TaxID=78633 RepID=UPI001FBB124D|nr:uncharacterized protein LOC125061545 [Pieris napi]
MKFQPVIPIPGNYEGIRTQRIDETSSRESNEVLNLFTHQTVFSIPNKTYKPFTYTIKVPPIENPIILNPNYKGILPDNKINQDDSELRRKEHAVKIIVERLKYVQSLTKVNKNDLYQNNFTHHNETKRHKLQNVENNETREYNSLKWEDKKESKRDLQSIKMTAFNIIDENIKKAVSVAEQIKQEIDVEMTGKRQEARAIKEKNDSYKKISSKKEYILKSAKRLAFYLGLQTIPYMRTYMQSNNFNRMLIKRIFLQLTNFTVCLSRHLSKTSNTSSPKLNNFNSFNSKLEDFVNEGEYYEEILSGAEMSRKFGKTPLEFTKRMDTVITEFEKRTGIERTTTRSRSRSRSTAKDKLVIGDFMDNISSDVEGKNVYRAFVTEEWSEYYDIGQPEISKSLKSEKYMESKTIKKETIEKLVEEKVYKETPLTYIAIVQAHVFTNQDAIFRDTQEEKYEERKEMFEEFDSKGESIIQAKEQLALCTQLEHQTIRINKEKPIEKVVVVESIEDITPVEEYKSFPAIEQVKTGIAVQKTTEVLEPVIEMQVDKLTAVKQAWHATHPSSISIASIKPVVLQDEKDDSFILPETKYRKSVTLIEPALKSIAETTKIDTVEPRVEILDITEKALSKPVPLIEEPVKSIAQVSQVEVNEPQSRPLELAIPTEVRSKELVQTPVQSVAVNMKTFTDQSNIEFINTPQTKQETSKIKLEPFSTTVAKKSEVYIDETTVSFEKKELDLEHLKQTIESPLKLVAQKSETNFDESCANVSTAKIQTELIRETYEEPIKAVAETFETSTDIANLSIFKRDALINENIKTCVEVPYQTVAQVGEVYSEMSEGLYKTQKNNEEKIKMTIEIPHKTIAQKIETSTEETTNLNTDLMQARSQNHVSSMESATKAVAEINQTMLSEKSIDFKSILESKESIQQSMEPMKNVAEKFEMYVSDIGEEFNKFKAKGTEPEIAVELPVRVTAETKETLTDEAIGFVDKTKLPKEKIQPLLVPESKRVAEVCITLIDEPKPDNLENDTFNIKAPKVLMEDSFRFIPETVVSIPEGPKLESFDLPTVHKVEAKIAVDKIEPTVITQVLLAEPHQIPFDVPQVKVKDPRSLIEEPLLIVPEASIPLLEGPKDGVFVVSKSSKEHANLNLKTFNATSVTEIAILEPQCDLLEVAEIKERKHHTLMEDAKMTVSHIQKNVILGPKDDNLLTPLIVKASASLKVNEHKALEGSLVISEEAIQLNSDQIKIDVRQPKSLVEESTKSVAENVQIRIAESEKSFSVSSKAIGQVASLAVQPLASLSQTAAIPLEEVGIGAKPSEILKNQAKVLVQELSAANIGQIIALSSVKDENFHTFKEINKSYGKAESFDTLKATINEVDVKKSKVEITDVLDDQCEEVGMDYKVEFAKDETKKIITEKNKKAAEILELDTEFIKKDIEYMENCMASTIQSVDADLKSKSHKSTVVISEVKLSESDSSKSPSPSSPVNDVYLFCVATPYARHEPKAETSIVELDYRSTQKRRYTQAEISVAQSIGIEYQISDSEDEVESIEIEYEYEKRQYESDINMGAVTQHTIETRMEEQSSEYAMENAEHVHSHVSKELQLSNESATIGTGSLIEITSKSQTSQLDKRHDIAGVIEQELNQSSSQRKSTKLAKSKKQSSKSLQHTEGTIQTESKENSGFYQSQVISQSEMQSLELNRQAIQQDIKVVEKDIESRHALLSEHDDTSKQRVRKEMAMSQAKLLSNKNKITEKQIESALTEKTRVDSQELKSPPIEPATPLTDEYVFRLTAPLPSREGTPVPRDCTSSSSSESDEEIRRKLIPHMELSIEQRIFDPPLPTPPTSPPVTSPASMTSSPRAKPFYSKPGLRGGGDTFDLTKEEVLEIGRQSNILASAIDKTIKRIEEYKSAAGIMEYSSSEISSSESRTVNEYQSEDNKVEVLIDKMVETSRRFSDEGEECGNSKEFIVPIVQEYTTEETHKTPDILGKVTYFQKDNLKSLSFSFSLKTNVGEEIIFLYLCLKTMSLFSSYIISQHYPYCHGLTELSTNYSSMEVKQERKMESTKLFDQLLHSVQSMVDPKASLEERLTQMQAQIAELSKLPDLIHQTLDDVKMQFEQLNYQVQQKSIEIQSSQYANSEQVQISEKPIETPQEQPAIEVTASEDVKQIEVIPEPDIEIQNIIDKRRLEAENKTKDEIMKERLSQELRFAAERLSPKLGFDERPKMPEDRPFMGFSPLPQTTPLEMGVPPVLSLPTGVPPKPSMPQDSTMAGPAFGETVKPGKAWKKLEDANLEQMLSETMAAQAEVIKGNAIGVNFMKYEKPPPQLDHLQHSEVYKAIHEMDQKPLKKVEMLKPAIAASDYVELEVLLELGPKPDEKAIEKTLKELKSLDGVQEAIFKDGAVMVETVLPSAIIVDIVSKTYGKRAVLQGFGETQSAVAMVSNQCGGTKVMGVVRFQQTDQGPLVADGSIDGLSPGQHGLHVHDMGDISEGCQSIGVHFNPHKSSHGSPLDPPDRRHAGDLGNIVADENGRATFRILDNVLKVWDIVGRSIAVTSQPDDLGRGSSPLSKENGNSGEPIACGIIARSAGIFQNPKRICACDGVVVWDERDRPLARKGRRCCENHENKEKKQCCKV